jgi:hypothetical protein
MKHRRRWAFVIGIGLAGLAVAATVIESEDMVIEVRTTPQANVIVATDVQRNGDDVTPIGLPRVYTEKR